MSVTEQTRPPASGVQRNASMLIDGGWVQSASGSVLDVENPAKREKIAEIPRGGAADVGAGAGSSRFLHC